MRILPDYPAHALHTAAVGRKTEVWRLLLGIVVMIGLYIVMALFYQQIIAEFSRLRPTFQDELIAGSTPLAMFVLLFSFGLIGTAVFIGVRLVHNRPALGVMGPLILAVPQFFRVAGMLVILGVVLTVLPPYGMGGPLVPNLGFGRWAVLLPLSLVAVFVQISAEEIFFRGYLQQQLGARFRSPLVWIVLPSALFALGHYQPAEAGQNAVMITLWAGMFGLLMADLTARAGTIGPALAVHFLNNVTALLITSLPDSLGGLALWHAPFGLEDTEQLRAWLPVDFALMIVSWLAARLALRR
ncbi:CPBP family intramembrane metalloprotease [Sulfitobacter sp. F26169L]|uniref:CPBP family intramembrane glutamic endopeptidase n=1 Tax=Sulfitobacter sp. F26169L TaxID=2996015 RepID=UPI002260E197|nr:CPBP family intramembrane glutamic endopeptidase [Sulfitobacter sp. F26169L]MCX7565717.1 CPBP family intramembrane metalloprotease [Sulfitobacter sp. F26169L]